MKMRKTTDLQNCVPRIFQFNSTFDNTEKTETPGPPFAELIEEYNIKITDKFQDANTILFTDYTLYDQNFEKIKYKDKCNYKVFAIHGIDLLANKKILSEKLRSTKYVPISYSLDSPGDIEDFKKNHKPGNTYILKKNLQRQEGMSITDDVDFIVKSALKEGYIVCQELLQNPLLVNRRKINLRIYLIVVITRNVCDFYIYNNGFIYYTPKYFEKNNWDKDVNITTGYIDRKVYETNPLTLQDLYGYLGKEKSTILNKNIIKCFQSIHEIYKKELVTLNKQTPGIKFVIMGCDIAPDENLDVKIHEINKGPDLSYKDERDKQVKYNLTKDTFGLIGVIKDCNFDNFIEIKT
jgi:hypothetical protein